MKIRYYHLTKVGSTNTWAKEHAHEFARGEITAITATEQTHGYGRYSRVWHTQPGKSLCLTLAFYLEEPKIQPFALCQLASLTLEEFLLIHDIRAKIKWPNDLLVNGKKIVGVLTERFEVNGLPFMIIGIGLNVNMTQSDLAEIPQPTTSMMLEKNQTFSLDAIKEFYVRLFVKRLQKATESNFSEVWGHWQKSLHWMIEHSVCVQTSATRLQGKVIELHSDGGLVIELPDGVKQVIQSADVNL